MRSIPMRLAITVCLVAGEAQARPKTVSPEEARAALNREQAAFARHQLEENAVNRQAYEAAVAARAAKIHYDQQAYDTAMADYHAAVARHEQAMRQWRADVAACRAGDTSHCAH